MLFIIWYQHEDSSLLLTGKISGSYINSSLTKSESINSAFDEAILLNNDGKTYQDSAINFFVVRYDKITTLGVDQYILEGVTGNSLITIAKDMGSEAIERLLDRIELLISGEVFLTVTTAKISILKK